jgi:hypothetical protein
MRPMIIKHRGKKKHKSGYGPGIIRIAMPVLVKAPHQGCEIADKRPLNVSLGVTLVLLDIGNPEI